MSARVVTVAVLVAASAAVAGFALLGGEPATPAPDRLEQDAVGDPLATEPTEDSKAPVAKVRQIAVPDLPRRLNPGSCRLYPPKAESRELTVFLDAGHGGYDPGAGGQSSSGKPVAESDAALAVALRAANRLRFMGYAVVLSRSTDDNVLALGRRDVHDDILTPEAVRKDVLARAACANAAHADVLVSIHFNSYGDPAVGGTHTLYSPNRPFSDDNAQLAEALQASALEELGAAGWDVRDRGISRDVDVDSEALTTSGAAYGSLLILGPWKTGHNESPSMMPGVVSEMLFLSRPTEADIASSVRGQKALSAAIVSGLESYLSDR